VFRDGGVLMQTVFKVQTSGPGLYEITGEVVRFVRESGVQRGLLPLSVQLNA
jgi:thiamine phosphate synthase YjbQ (UPF0047 family)